MLITAIFTLTILSIFWVLFLSHRMHNSQSFLENSTKALPWINWHLTVSSDSQLYLIRSLLSDIFRGADKVSSLHQNSHKNLFQLERTSSLLQMLELFILATSINLLPNWLLVWTNNTSLPQDHGS